MVKNNTIGKAKVDKIFDAGTFVELGTLVKSGDEPSGVVCGYGAIDGKLAYAFVQDTDRRKGAFDELHAKKIERLYDLAIKGGAPVIGVFDSAGALVYEGAAALSGYGRLMKCVSKASGIIPQIAVVDGVCTGTSAALCAMFDIVIGVEGSNAPEIFAKLAKSREEAFAYATELVKKLPANNCEVSIPEMFSDDLNRKVVLGGKTTKELVSIVADNGNLFELYEDYGENMTCGFADFGGVACGVVCAFGKLGTKEARKASKLISFCDSFYMPVVTLVDSEGIKEEDKETLASELSRLAYAYTSASTALLTVVVGKAYGAAFTLLGSKSLGADLALALEGAQIAVLPPETAVAFLWNDKITKEKSREDVENEWKEKYSSAQHAAEQGEIDDIVAENELRQRICAGIAMLACKADGVPARKHINMPL